VASGSGGVAAVAAAGVARGAASHTGGGRVGARRLPRVRELQHSNGIISGLVL